MIEIKTLDQKDVGDWVWYRPTVGDWEKGRIKSWGDKLVFVVYECAGKWTEYKNYTAAATEPGDLDFIEHQGHCRADKGFVCACLPPTLEIKEDSFL